MEGEEESEQGTWVQGAQRNQVNKRRISSGSFNTLENSHSLSTWRGSSLR
ncbi:hypothetical protein Scep_016528 [Stephania cephalantha]|uniref:Uncharacterized protein n=1 Tax=Stephania cephalantha TaxID=152367 RepID=A0AAP0NUQ9_9MAGN